METGTGTGAVGLTEVEIEVEVDAAGLTMDVLAFDGVVVIAEVEGVDVDVPS